MTLPAQSIYNITALDGLGNVTHGFQETTNAPTSRGYGSEKHALAQFLEVYYSLALLVFGTIGNLLSLAVLSRKAFRSSPIGICLRFLALADLTALYTGPLYFTAIALHDYNFRKVSVASCRIHRWVSYVSVDLSAWTLIVMSTARLTSVMWPMKNIFTRRTTYVTLFVTFIVIVGINSPMFILYGTVHLPKRTLLCVATKPSYRYFTDHIWSWLVLIKFGLLPGSILLVVNIILVIRVYRSRRHVDKLKDGEDRVPLSTSALGRSKPSFSRWLRNSKFFARSSATERPVPSSIRNVSSKVEGDKTAVDGCGANARAGFRVSTETIVSTVTENEKSNTAYDKSHNNNSADKETLCQNGEQFLQVPSTRRKAKRILTFATFPKYQLRKLQRKCGSFTFPKRDRRAVTLKTTDSSKEEGRRSEFHNRSENGVVHHITENDETTDATFRGKTSQSCDGMTMNVYCTLNTVNRSQSLPSTPLAKHQFPNCSGDAEDEKKVRLTSERRNAPTGVDIKSIGNNSLPQKTDPDHHGLDSFPTNRAQTPESEPSINHKDNVSDNENISLCENCDHVETLCAVSIVSSMSSPENGTLSDSNIHHTISINCNGNTKSNGVNNKTNKDAPSGANLTKSKSSSALQDHDFETTDEATLPQRIQISQDSISVSKEGKHLCFARSSKCTELSLSTHTLPADTNSLTDYLKKHKDINISSTSMNSISDTSIHELKLAVRGKFSARSSASRSRRLGVTSQRQKHRNLTLTVIVFNAMFILCNLPIIIYMAGRTYIFSGEKGTNSPQYIMEICSNYSMYTNNAINFVLYCITGSRFRQELKRMLCQFFNFFTGFRFCRRKK